MTRIYRYKKAKAMPLGQYTGPQPDDTKTKPKLIKAYVEWLTNFKESLETTSDNTQLEMLKNSVEEQINFLNSEKVLSMQAPQINRQMNGFHKTLQRYDNNIPEFDIAVASTGTTAEALQHAATKAAIEIGSPLPIQYIKRAEFKHTERPDIPQKDLVQVGKKVNEDKFELNFFKAYLEGRQNIRKNFENLQKSSETAGTLVYHAIDNLDSNFYKNIKPPPAAHRPRRAATAAASNVKSDDDSDDDDVKRALQMSLELNSQNSQPYKTPAQSPAESDDSQVSIGGRKKTRKRNKKHLLRMRRKL